MIHLEKALFFLSLVKLEQAAIQLIEPYSNRHVNLAFGGIESTDKFMIDQKKSSYKKVSEKIRKLRKKLSDQNKLPARAFTNQVNDAYAKSVVHGSKNALFTIFTTINRVYQLIDDYQSQGF